MLVESVTASSNAHSRYDETSYRRVIIIKEGRDLRLLERPGALGVVTLWAVLRPVMIISNPVDRTLHRIISNSLLLSQ